MANFEQAVPFVLRHEGGFVNDAADPGGATNYGISLRWLKHQGEIDANLAEDINHDGVVDERDILALSPEKAAELYRTNWWDKFGYGSIARQDLATKIFDAAVNMGPKRAHTLAQTALLACGYNIACDGALGPQTLAALNAGPKIYGHDLLAELMEAESRWYRSLATTQLSLGKYLRGWLARANDTNF